MTKTLQNNNLKQQNLNNNKNIKNEGKNNKDTRIVAVDRFRGVAVFCMVVFQLIANFDAFGVLSKIASHNLNVGIIVFKNTTIADLVAPLFMFAIALTYKYSYDRRVEKYGKSKTVKHFVLRNLMIVGVGALLYIVNVIIDIAGGDSIGIVDYIAIALFGIFVLNAILMTVFKCFKTTKHTSKIFKTIMSTAVVLLGVFTLAIGLTDFIGISFSIAGYQKLKYWLVLQSLGVAGLIALPFVNLKFNWRAVATLLLGASYVIYCTLFDGYRVINAVTQGGFIGGFGWALLILIGSLFTELFFKNKTKGYGFALATAIVAAVMYFVLPINKSGVHPDPTYIIVTTAISITAFIVFDLFNFYKSKFDPLAWWGKYPLLLYLMEFGVIGVFTEFAPDSIVKNAPLWLAIIIVLIFITIFTSVVYLLNKRNKKIAL